MQLMATLSNEEILQACRDWIEKQHGLQVNTDLEPTLHSNYEGTWAKVRGYKIEFEIRPPETPYRG
jgi:hypothetical protein